MSKFYQKCGHSFGDIPNIPEEVEIHCSDDPSFTKRYGGRVKKAGGQYSSCYGHQKIRLVTLPCEGNEALISAIAHDFGAENPWGVTMVADHTRIRGAQSWMLVHYVPKEGEGTIFDRFIEAYHKALQSAVDRGHLLGIYEGSAPRRYVAEAAETRAP